jgi:hypothetical protein
MSEKSQRIVLAVASAARWISGGLAAASVFGVATGGAPSDIVWGLTVIMFVLTVAIEYQFIGIADHTVLSEA